MMVVQDFEFRGPDFPMVVSFQEESHLLPIVPTLPRKSQLLPSIYKKKKNKLNTRKALLVTDQPTYNTPH